MTESKPSRALHNGRLTSKASSAALGFSLTSEAALTPTPMASHAYTLQFLISIIKNLQARNPSQQNK